MSYKVLFSEGSVNPAEFKFLSYSSSDDEDSFYGSDFVDEAKIYDSVEQARNDINRIMTNYRGTENYKFKTIDESGNAVGFNASAKKMKKAQTMVFGEQVEIPDTIECNGGTLHLVEREHSVPLYEGKVQNAFVSLYFYPVSDSVGEDLDIFIGNSKSELEDEGYVDPWTGTEGRFNYSEIADYVNEGVRSCRERGYLYKSSDKKMWKTESAISKRCPNGYHKDPQTGQCVDANGNYYQGKQEQSTQTSNSPKEQKPSTGKTPKHDDKTMEEYGEKTRNLKIKQFNQRDDISHKAKLCDKRMKEDYPKELKQLDGYLEGRRFDERGKLYRLMVEAKDNGKLELDNLRKVIDNYDEIKDMTSTLKEKYSGTKILWVIESIDNLVDRYKKTYDKRHVKLPKEMKELKQRQAKEWKDIEDKYGITAEEYDKWYWKRGRSSDKSSKKMKKSYGNYIDAIENFIVDCPDGCYYNAIFDEFSDVLSEDEVMDALGTLMDDNIICYNEKNEKFEVCDKAEKMKKSITDDMEMSGGQINVSAGPGRGSENWDFLDYTMELEDAEDKPALDDLYDKINSGQERFTIHRNDGWDYDITIIKSTRKSKVAKGSASLENLVNTHIKEVNGESYGSGYVTDDGWYDDQRYSLASVNEVKIGTRNFIRRSFGGGRDVYEYWKDVGNDISYRIRFIVPSTMSGYTIGWDILDPDGAILGTDSHEVYDADVDNVVQTIIDTVNQCVREAKSELGRIDSGDYLASAKKSYSPDYKDFAGMVQSLRNTGNHRNVFKE